MCYMDEISKIKDRIEKDFNVKVTLNLYVHNTKNNDSLNKEQADKIVKDITGDHCSKKHDTNNGFNWVQAVFDEFTQITAFYNPKEGLVLDEENIGAGDLL